ncbi:increased DNA methylation 3-like [Tasmannia lanceolata]|uniref:increased DNA methylation 3-like n=1 Tax=Tasmannia lanceolata TaxID=3420 RepID=UPI00406283D8
MDSANTSPRHSFEASTTTNDERSDASSAWSRNSPKRRHLFEDKIPMPMPMLPPLAAILLRTISSARPAAVLPSTLSLEQQERMPSIALTGATKEGATGPPSVDIGIREDVYVFQVALPGETKYQCQFSCKVTRDGEVQLRGRIQTGETVIRGDEFEMKTQHPCPPGPFKVSFSLPGPVDPRMFKAEFYEDGVLQGMVKKSQKTTRKPPC